MNLNLARGVRISAGAWLNEHIVIVPLFGGDLPLVKKTRESNSEDSNKDIEQVMTKASTSACSTLIAGSKM